MRKELTHFERKAAGLWGMICSSVFLSLLQQTDLQIGSRPGNSLPGYQPSNECFSSWVCETEKEERNLCWWGFM